MARNGLVTETNSRGRRLKQKHSKRISWRNLLCWKNVKTNSTASAWRLVINRFILEHVQSCTITEAHRQARCKDFTLTVEELEAFISIMYVHGMRGKMICR